VGSHLLVDRLSLGRLPDIKSILFPSEPVVPLLHEQPERGKAGVVDQHVHAASPDVDLLEDLPDPNDSRHVTYVETPT
jgi:hypothetical protein